MGQKITQLSQSSDSASMLSRGSVELAITIPENYALGSGLSGGQHDEKPAPTADTFMVMMKSSRNNKWKCGRMFTTGYDSNSAYFNNQMSGSVIVGVRNGKITLDSYFMAETSPSQKVPFGQTITAKVIFFDQPL